MECQDLDLNQVMVEDIKVVADLKLAAMAVVGEEELELLVGVEVEEELLVEVEEEVKESAVLNQIVQAGHQFVANGDFVKLLINLMEIQMLVNVPLLVIAQNGLLLAQSLVIVKLVEEEVEEEQQVQVVVEEDVEAHVVMEVV